MVFSTKISTWIAAGKLYSACLSIGICLLSSLFSAQNIWAIEAGMPNPPASPTHVTCGLMILDVISIDDVEESLEVELALIASWNDPRLAFDADEEGVDRKIFQGDFQFLEVFSGWWPQFLIVNQVGSGDVSAIKIEIYPDGKVKYFEQRNAILETPMSLQDYPFDTQKLRVLMIPFGNNKDEVLLEVDEQAIGVTENHVRQENDVNVAGWDLQSLSMKASEVEVVYKDEVKHISQIITTITFERRSWQLVWQMLFPMLLIVSMIWSIFWIDLESLADRLNISFIGVLTIVAYQFVIIENMPRMSYLTFTDTLLLVSFVTMSVTIPQSLYVYSLSRVGKKNRAAVIDRTCRWALPVGYVVMVITTFLWFRLT